MRTAPNTDSINAELPVRGHRTTITLTPVGITTETEETDTATRECAVITTMICPPATGPHRP
ncbi:MAG: hypothetical protein AB7U20_13110 [Planctomycetaceae bacterium]